MSATSTRKRKSPVWELFDEQVVVSEKDGKKVKKVSCKLCDQQLVDGGGTTNQPNEACPSKTPLRAQENE